MKIHHLKASAPKREDLLKYFTISSGYRIVATVNAYRQRYGKWPVKISMDAGMFEALPRDIFTPLGWEMMASKLTLASIDKGTVIAEGDDGTSFDYENIEEHQPPKGERADEWIWGIKLAE
jgi:hypothetical protein